MGLLRVEPRTPRGHRPWTVQEDRKLLALTRRKRPPTPLELPFHLRCPYWDALAELLGRSPGATEARWRALQAGLRVAQM